MPPTGGRRSPGHGRTRRGAGAPRAAGLSAPGRHHHQVLRARVDRAGPGGAHGLQHLHKLPLHPALPAGRLLHPAQLHAGRRRAAARQQHHLPAPAAGPARAQLDRHLPGQVSQQRQEGAGVRHASLGRVPAGEPQQPELRRARALGAAGVHVGRGQAHPPAHPLRAAPAQRADGGGGGVRRGAGPRRAAECPARRQPLRRVAPGQQRAGHGPLAPAPPRPAAASHPRPAHHRRRGDDGGLSPEHHRALEAADAAEGRVLRGAAPGGGRRGVARETVALSPAAPARHRARQGSRHAERRGMPPAASTAPLPLQVRAWAWGPGPRMPYALDGGTRYEFQVRCRLGAAGSPWSAWSSPFLYTTPEAAPAAAPDVWRRLGPAFPNGSREVTVLIEPLPPHAAHGRILGYVVSGQSRAAVPPLCNTSATACRLLVPPGVRALYVTAYNAKGASGPASIALAHHLAGDREFPAPAAVQVRREDGSRVAVTWRRPRRSAKPLLWFVLESLSAAPYGQEHRFFWKKVPKQDTLAYIQEEAAAGSHINVSVYAVYPDGVSKPCSGQVFPEEQFLDSTYSQISYDDDIGGFLGLGVSVVVLSVVFVILMFKKSARKRISTIIVPLMPKWLLEDFPHMENSNVIKSLQEKSEFTRNNFSEPFLDNSDPTVTEIEEMPVHEEYRTVDIRKKHSEAAPEKAACLRSSVPASSAATELVSDYKPQLSDGNPLGYVAANFYQTQPHTLAPEPETNVFFRDYTSPVTYLWNAEGTEQHAFLLEKINLILNNNRSGQNNAFDSAQEEQNTLLESQWEKTLSSENAQEQTLVPDELVSCLRTMQEESVDIKICFPQGIGRLF